MKRTRSLILVALAIALVAGAAWILTPKRSTAQDGPSRPVAVTRTSNSLRPKSVDRWTEPRLVHAAVPQQPVRPKHATRTRGKLRPELAEPETAADQNEPQVTQAEAVTPEATQTPQGTSAVPETIQDPMARAALAYVGADPDAETYWYEAINDPNLSAHERQDLIEDLNEDGLSDPQNPTIEDLPLILNRIDLIEAIIGDAMDEVNADAFQEAYQDLVTLAVQAMSNGQLAEDEISRESWR
jgi:hypothetical protein